MPAASMAGVASADGLLRLRVVAKFPGIVIPPLRGDDIGTCTEDEERDVVWGNLVFRSSERYDPGFPSEHIVFIGA